MNGTFRGIKHKSLSKRGRGMEWHDVPRSVHTIQPDMVRTQLRYSDMITLAGTVLGSVLSYYFSGNSIYDPDQSSTGHFPRFRNTWLPLYTKYLVIRSRMSAACYNLGLVGDTVYDDLVGLGLFHVGGGLPTDFNTFLEDPVWDNNVILSGSNLAPGNAKKLTKNWDLLKESAASGLSYIDLLETAWSASMTANPTYQPYFLLYHAPGTGAVNNAVIIKVEIMYDIILYMPKQIMTSI